MKSLQESHGALDLSGKTTMLGIEPHRAWTNAWVLTKGSLKILSIPQTDSLDIRL